MYDLSLAAALRQAGTDVVVVTGRPLFSPPSAPVHEAPARYVRSPYLRGLSHRMGRVRWRVFDLDLRWFERGAFRALAREAPKPDLVQVTGLPRLARRIEKTLRLPAVLLFPGPPSPGHRSEINACRTVVGVGAVTPYLKANFREDVHDMTAGVDTSLFRPGGSEDRSRPRMPSSRPVILFAGRLVPLKNLPLLIDAFSGIREEIPEARLLIVGDGPMRSDLLKGAARAGLRTAARAAKGPSWDAGAADLVHVGEVPHDAMPSHYAAADLLVLTSLNESFSLVALEAMACGLVVLAPAVGYLPRLIEDGVSGALYPAGDRRSLVERAVGLLRDPAGRRAMGAAAREAAVRRHSWVAVASEFSALYRNVLAV